MTRQEYEQKRRECFVKFCKDNGIDQKVNISIFDAFDQIFDRAYALGKHEKDADKEEMFTCEKSKVLYRFRMAEACKIGNNPETDYWIGYSKAIQDLFGLEGEPYVTPNDADTVIQGWVFVDEITFDRILCVRKVTQGEYEAVWDSGHPEFCLGNELFPDMVPNTLPEPVEIIIKRKKNG